MPRGDGTGPDGKGPKSKNKGWPDRKGKGNGDCKRSRECIRIDKKDKQGV